jgi:hypothetical protein
MRRKERRSRISPMVRLVAAGISASFLHVAEQCNARLTGIRKKVIIIIPPDL